MALKPWHQALAEGQKAEALWCGMLASAGRLVVPICDLADDKAPFLHTQNGTLVSPDLLSFRGPDATWHEVKAKAQPGWYRKLQRWEHGIDYAHWLDYLEVRRQTKRPVMIVVHEERSPASPTRKSTLTPGDVWLVAEVGTIQAHGERRLGWPGGMASPGRRGRSGAGGWLWPRMAMRHAEIRDGRIVSVAL